MATALDELDRKMQDVAGGELRYQRHGFNAGISVFVWTAFWDMAARHQDDWKFVLLTWVCVLTAVWAAVHL